MSLQAQRKRADALTRAYLNLLQERKLTHDLVFVWGDLPAELVREAAALEQKNMNLPISLTIFLILRDVPRRNRTRSPYLTPQFELAAFKEDILGIQKQKKPPLS